MSSATAAHHQPAASRPGSRLGTQSPVTEKKSIIVKSEDQKAPASVQVPVEQPPDPGIQQGAEKQLDTNGTNGTPGGGDYFSLTRPSDLDSEPNPFEQSFASRGSTSNNDPLSTPKAILPPVTAMTSPAPLMSGSFSWSQSLRSGPLSPAMLQGPASNSNNLGFDSHFRTGLTPNESGIRSGLTPGASGMFPAPSPSSLLQPFGGSTPGTMEFQKTAMSAAARKHPHSHPNGVSALNSTSLDQRNNGGPQGQHDQQKPRQPSDSMNDPNTHHAANSLYMLAQCSGTPSYQQVPTSQPGGLDSSPNLRKAAVNNASAIGRQGSQPSLGNAVRGVSEISNDMSDSSQEVEQQFSKSRGAKGKGASNGKRKNEDTKPKSNKRNKNKLTSPSEDGMQDDEEDQVDKNGKKVTDEEKRKNFLERNRVAALKCRQRKKQWLANLQAKVELYGSENDALNATVQSLREEILSLKTLLLAHKDCPVARTNGLQIDIATVSGGNDYSHVSMMPPYQQMGMPAGVMQGQSDSRRYS